MIVWKFVASGAIWRERVICYAGLDQKENCIVVFRIKSFKDKFYMTEINFDRYGPPVEGSFRTAVII